MKTLKTLIVAAAVTAVTTLTGCTAISDINARGQALYEADKAFYDAMPNSISSYHEQNPQYSTSGS